MSPVVLFSQEIDRSLFMGPFASGNSYPLFLTFINPNPETASTQKAGTLSISLLETYANSGYRNFEPSERQYGPSNLALDVDYEALSNLLRVRYSPIDRLDFFSEVSLLYYHSGYFDPAIQAFHKFFGFSNGSRDLFPDNVLLIRARTKGSTWFEYTNAVTTVPWIQLGVKYELLPPTVDGTAFSISTIAKIPLSTISNPFESKSLDWALMANIDQVLGPVKLSGNLGLAIVGPSDFVPAEYVSSLIIPFAFNFEWLLGNDFALVFTVDATSSPFATGHPKLDRLGSGFMLGVKARLATNLVMELGFQEEFITFNAPDIGAFIGFELKIPLVSPQLDYETK